MNAAETYEKITLVFAMLQILRKNLSLITFYFLHTPCMMRSSLINAVNELHQRKCLSNN